MLRASFIRFSVVVFCFIYAACGIQKQRIMINDYVIQPNGFVVNNMAVNAFVFENNLSNKPFQNFITTYFITNTSNNKSVQVKENGVKLTILFYDNDEFEKFFGSQNFAVQNLETASQKFGNNSKFIAMSVIAENNEDCLNPNSLTHKIAVDYLLKLKNQYLSAHERSKN